MWLIVVHASNNRFLLKSILKIRDIFHKFRVRHDRDRMVVKFITSNAISAYHH